jgi:hypothetical protein
MEIEYLQFWSMSFLAAKVMTATVSQVSSIYSFGSTPSPATEENGYNTTISSLV